MGSSQGTASEGMDIQNGKLRGIGSTVRAFTNEVEPLVSVVVAVFNGVGTLARCVDSVTCQTYPHKELIVIDGGSVDGTKGVIEAHAHRIAYWESEPDRGIYHAWNKALKVVRGDWVYFLGADDYFSDELVLARVAPLLESRGKDFRVAYGRVNLVRNDGSVIATFGSSWDRKRFFQLMTLPHQGVFHHRSLFQEHGGFNEEFRIAGDYELLLSELKSRDPLFIPDVTIAAMQFGGMSSDGRSAVEALREIKRAQDIHGVSAVSPLWRWALAKAYMRRFLSSLFGEEWARAAANCYRRLTFRSPV
jgi:glycosyltransferase involved in cell wall biosynthesis